MSTPGVPEILARRELARTRFFRVESLSLRFANGQTREYERLPAGGLPAVIVVAWDEVADELLLIREYAAGFHEVQLSLPKGSTEGEETLEQATNRELMEEVGHGARHIEHIKQLSLAPGHMGFTIHVMLAHDLFEARLPGDEPEPPEVVRWPVARLDQLIADPDFNEARAIAALSLVRQRLLNPSGDAQR